MFPARLELATFRVLGGRDNHYTTETFSGKSVEIKIFKIKVIWKTTAHALGEQRCSFDQWKVWRSTVILGGCYFPGNICLQDGTERRSLFQFQSREIHRHSESILREYSSIYIF